MWQSENGKIVCLFWNIYCLDILAVGPRYIIKKFSGDFNKTLWLKGILKLKIWIENLMTKCTVGL